ncbi:MAG: VWA domain-containing protein [Propionibacteriaceae bacterium]|nr:VWA domain-containing protein [Propionibacteriaceae bacterium]
MIFGMSFVEPYRLLLLAIVPILVIVYVFLVLRKNKSGIRFTNTTILGKVTTKQSQWRRHLAVALSLASLITLVVAWARPNGEEMVPRDRSTIVLIIDVSLSMGAVDVAPSRIEAAKTAALQFVRELPPQFNVSVVSLSGNPRVRMQPSTDRLAVEQAINSLTLDESTAIGEALFTAISALYLAPEGDGDSEIAPGAFVLLSDGQNTTGRAPMQAAGEVAELKIPVYTISFGTENGYVDLDGSRERVAPDPEQLRAIAEITSGEAYQAENLPELERIYRNIRTEVGYVMAEKEVTAQWAGYGLALAALAALAAISLGVRWP